MTDPQTENSARDLYAALSVLLRDPKTRTYLLAHDQQAVLQGELALYNRTLAFNMCENLADREHWDEQRNLASRGLNEVNDLIKALRTRKHPHHPEGFCTPATCAYSQALLASMRGEAWPVVEETEYEEIALFMCTAEDRWLVGGQDTVDDLDDDSVTKCRHCGAVASECDGTVRLNREYPKVPEYKQHYTSADAAGHDATWSVYVESYARIHDHEPIEGSSRKVSTHPSEEEADAEARRLQVAYDATLPEGVTPLGYLRPPIRKSFPQTPEEARVCVHFVKVWSGHECGLCEDADGGYQWVTDEDVKTRLEYLRGELRAERISMGELIDLQGMAYLIEEGDVELLEAAGVPEFPDDEHGELGMFQDNGNGRYGEPYLYGGRQVVRCLDCSTRATVVLVDVDELVEHDAGHDQ